MKNDSLAPLQQQVRTLRMEGRYKETIEAGHLLLEKGAEVEDFKSILVAHLHIAVSYYCMGCMEEAFEHIGSYEELCRKHGDEEDFLQLYNVLFLLYEFMKDLVKAKETLKSSIALGKKLRKFQIVSNGYSNYSHLLLLEEKYEEARSMAEAGLEAAHLHQPASPILELRVKLNLAKSYIGLEDYRTSYSYIDSMVHDPILESFSREKSNCYELLGHWYAKQHRYDEALDSLRVAKELAEHQRDVYLLRSIQEERCRLCELTGNVELGYVVQKEYIALLKEINQRELAHTALKLEIKQSVASLERRASLDFLTGLYNRKFLESTTNQWLEEASATQENVVCLVFDIDHFKSINDTYGHLFGDEVVKQVGRALTQLFREQELVARYGGDEFVVVLRGSSLAWGSAQAEHIQQAIRSLHPVKDGCSVALTVSIGVADNAQGQLASFADLFHAADTALYRAKQRGKNQTCVVG